MSKENEVSHWERKYLFTIVIISFFVSLIPLLVEQQDSFVKSFLSTGLIFIWLVIIFLFGLPKSRANMVENVSSAQISVILVGNLIGPVVIILALGASLTNIIVPFLFWYLLPSIILFITLQIKSLSDLERLFLTAVTAILFWIGFDHRYTMVIFDIFEGLSYIMNGFWFVSLILSSYGFKFEIRQSGNQKDEGLKPTFQGLKYGQIAAIVVSIIIIPAGLLTSFLSWNPQIDDIINIIIGFIGIYLTISLQEELIFRGILLKELDRIAKIRNINLWIPLLVTSLLFGLTHWNNEVPQYVIHYIVLATIAGIAYGWAYRKSGLFGAMITHTLVDWVWGLFLLRS